MAETIAKFIARWADSGGSEQANAQMFLTEFCDALELPRPEPAKPINEDNLYSFERKVYVPRGAGGSELKKLDLYRRGCFVLESKQGQDKTASLLPGLTISRAVQRDTRAWEDAMQRAKNQAENYVRCLPAAEGRPPFLIVADIGYCFDLYAEFSQSGGLYLPYPGTRQKRIHLRDLLQPETRRLFQDLWRDPLSLDLSRRAARVTEKVAAHLAELARLLEIEGHYADTVAQFLMRCIFTMFAEDVGLIPRDGFTLILEKSLADPALYPHLVIELWRAMNLGAVSTTLGAKLLRFNGQIFANPDALPLTREQMGILLEAARADWQEVERAIFGTLLERALDPKERHKLGAHYTPRAYVERLVWPTLIQPLRGEWTDAQTEAALLAEQGQMKEALQALESFYKLLRNVRVLDPACGSGNFLYVSLEHLKRLEGEVLEKIRNYGGIDTAVPIDPHQFLGLEVNPRAAHIAEMVLWIGYLQWHFRTHGQANPPEPVIKKFDNIKRRDALITWRQEDFAADAQGRVFAHWDGETYKTDPATGRQVPDENATAVDVVYEGVKATEWPKADFIVGNPPFVGGKDKRRVLGAGYFQALTHVYAELPPACDYVMYPGFL